jgi:hypothetical protein
VNFTRRLLLAACLLSLGLSSASYAVVASSNRTTLSLDGTWDIEDSVVPDAIPKSFRHVVPVPGLAHLATPAFADVDKFQSKQLLSSLVYYGLYSQADYDKLGDIRGIAQQSRNYFWYRKTFHAPKPNSVALLRVSKAQFGTVVYLNGVRIGEHDSCFTAAYFDVSRAIRWNQRNELVIRIGAHPGVLPASVNGGTDFEKARWTPGIYDSVSLICADNPVISVVQAAPQLADSTHPVAGVLVQTELHNYASHAVSTEVKQQVFQLKPGQSPSAKQTVTVQLSAGETKLVKQTLPIPDAHLWSPEDPFLYRVDTSTAGDAVQTRFGMREFHFDTVTQKGYLNGRPYFLRGSNIGLHRFFEDAHSGSLPWNEAWVHRLLVDIPKRLHWNAFRFTIGPVPDRWLEIADEAGILIEYEYAVWVGSPVYTQWRSSYDSNQLISEYTEWLRDSWNHPSIFLWDATNESFLPELASKVLPAVRSLDLSNRPWENSYNDPGDPNDPVEDHTYFLESVGGVFDASGGGKPFEFSDLESTEGTPSNPFTKSAHAKILNEYGWIWLNRDGSPTLLTQKLFPKLLGKQDTAENRRILCARVLAHETQLWRAFRRYAGVMSFPYLTSSGPDAFTSDPFVDLQKLELEPNFEQAIEQAFRPLGVYLNFWHPSVAARESNYYLIYMVNDEDRPRSGKLRLEFATAADTPGTVQEVEFSLPSSGAQQYTVRLQAPSAPGSYALQAVATADGATANPTISRQDVQVTAAAAH